MKYCVLCSILFIVFIVLMVETSIVENFHEYKYTAVIIEPREHPALEFVLKNFNDNLSEEWQFVIFHGNKNIEYTKHICDKVFHPERVHLVNLGVDNLTISDYSALFYTEQLYSNIPTDTFLIFQTDSMICSQYKDYINHFLSYDYVGAPWSNGTVGNGGLSLRKKSKMKEIVEKCKNVKDGDNYINEDMVFSKGCDTIEVDKPSTEKAKTFSIENVYHDKSFGIHKAYATLGTDKIGEWCPDIVELKRLNEKNI